MQRNGDTSSTQQIYSEFAAQDEQMITEADRQAVFSAIADERDAAIQDIHADVVQVHELICDVQSMIAEQAPMVDSIVDHVAKADANAASAVVEIKKKDKRLRSTTCIVL